MRFFVILAAVLILLGAPQAMAAQGFVVEIKDADPEVGIQLMDDTNVTIAANGHMVIMTESGQMIRKNGPFEGTAGELLGGQAGGGSESMEGGLLESLLELAEVSGKSTEQLGAVRGTEAEGGDTPLNMVSTAVSSFCMTPDTKPTFFTSDPPAVDEPLIVRRRVRPVQYLQTTWPAGANSLEWPDDWPRAEDGRYIWALGSRGTVALRIIEIDDAGMTPLEKAAMQYNLGCEVQAMAGFQAALPQQTQ